MELEFILVSISCIIGGRRRMRELCGRMGKVGREEPCTSLKLFGTATLFD
jgi:hypothetical protein